LRAQLISRFEKVRASYWFVPSLMALTAVAFAAAATGVDNHFGSAWLGRLGWLYANRPEGARALLSTLAGSMITVAGVTFSMTIVAISHASSQIGPRLLSNFMRDRGNQFTLGTFIATFLYCLLVLRTVRGGDPNGGGEAAAAFVPHTAILGALLLAVLSVAVLIYFIHHIPDSISMASLLERVSRTLSDRIEVLFPTEIGEAASTSEGSRKLPGDFETRSEVIRFEGSDGYLQYIDHEALLEIAEERDLVIAIASSPGDYLTWGSIVARVYPSGHLGAAARARVASLFATGDERTPRQDVLFPGLELTEIAIRALSPGVNDPYTAVRCIDRLGSALASLARRGAAEGYRSDGEGTLRVAADTVDFARFTDTVMDALRPHAARDPMVCVHLLKTITAVSERTPHVRQKTLSRHAEYLYAAARESTNDARDLALLHDAFTDAQRRTSG